MFGINEEELENAFSFDSTAMTAGLEGGLDLSGLQGAGSGSLDLSGMIDLEQIAQQLPEMEGFDLSQISGALNLDVSSEQLGAMAGGLLDGYLAYAAQDPSTDYANLGEALLAYLNTGEARQVLADHIREIIESSGLSVTPEQLGDLAKRILQGFLAYAQGQGMTDPSQMDAYLEAYLQTGEAQQIAQQWVDEVFAGGAQISITGEQLEKLAQELAAGYQSYAAANGLPDPSKMQDSFLAYLGTDSAREQLAQGMAGLLDTEALEQQLTGAVEDYMQTVMESGAAQSLTGQITAAVQAMMAQISEGLQSAMQSAAVQIGSNIENALSLDPEAFRNAFEMNMDGEELTELLLSMETSGTATATATCARWGTRTLTSRRASASTRRILTSKDEAVGILDAYNSRMEAEGKEEQVITYTDMVGTLMSSVTNIVNVISYVPHRLCGHLPDRSPPS